MIVAAAPSTRRVEALMGTVVSIDVRDRGLPAADIESAIEATVETLRSIEARFSPYQADSEISRIGRGELEAADAHPDVRFVLERCEEIREASGGAFDVYRHRPDGRLDPSGFVKGWAVEVAATALRAAHARSFTINAGGDVLAAGEVEPGRPWRVGIRHPDDARQVVAVLGVRDLAVATSGAYERGAHIVDPRSGLSPRELTSVTVVGPSLAWADGAATAAFVMGESGLAWIASQPGYAALASTADGRLVWTEGIEALRI